MSDEVEPYIATVPEATNGHRKVLKKLSALDRVFEAHGEVALQCGDQTIVLPIQSVDLELVQSLCKPYVPKPKVTTELVNGRRQIVENFVDSNYKDQMDQYNRIQSYVYVCCALMIDIEDRHGTVVWSADNTVHQVNSARQALKDMGLVDSQVVVILNAATALTQAVEDRQIAD